MSQLGNPRETGEPVKPERGVQEGREPMHAPQAMPAKANLAKAQN